VRRLMPIVSFAVLALALLALAGAARPAAAVTYYPPWEEGTAGHPFSFATPLPSGIGVDPGGDQSVSLARETLAKYGVDAPMWDGFPAGKRPDPRDVYPLPNGDFLVSGGKDVPFVKEVNASGTVVWEYVNGQDGLLRKPFSAEPATFGGRACVLISDRIACRVFAVDKASKQIVWQYGRTDTPGAGPDRLADPFCATQIAPTAGQTDGDVLIADSQDNHRVIEVRSDDFAGVDAPDHGFSADSIVWQYGVTGQPGKDPGYLMFARSPQRLPDGDTLLADSANKRILVVRTSDYDPSKPANGYTQDSIVWSYEDGVDGTLLDANTARLVTSGALEGTVIVTDCDLDAQRVLLIDRATKQVTQTFDMRTLDRPSWATSSDASSPREARLDAQGALWIADAGFGQILRVGYPSSATVQSDSLGCGKPDMVKAFDRLKVFASDVPAGASFSIQYSVDGGLTFKRPTPEGDGRNFRFAKGTVGRRFIYRLTLTTTRDRWVTPTVDALTIHFTKATTGGDGGGGGGSGGSKDNGSGVVVYPSTATAGGTAASGTGTGTGAYGGGTGSGTSGSGAGSAASGASGASASSSVTDLQPPVQSTGSGPPQQVQGYQTQGQEGVSGVPLTGAKGEQLPEPERPGPPVPVAALIAAALVVLAAFFVPWPFVAARMRGITGFDHAHPRRFSRVRLLHR
jgi:hypothetical protein